jgi:hypothetical protein
MFTLFIFSFCECDVISTAGETMIISAILDIIDEFTITYSDSFCILSSYLIAEQNDTLHQNCLSFLEKKGNSFDLINLGPYWQDWLCIFPFRLFKCNSRIKSCNVPISLQYHTKHFSNFSKRTSCHKSSNNYFSLFSSGSVLGLVVGGYVIDSFGW